MAMYAAIAVAVVLIIYGPALLVRVTIRWYSKPIADLPGTGGELAEYLLERRGLGDVLVERTDEGRDHYSPGDRAVRLSPSNFDGRSLSAVAIATHEVAHAVQHADGHPMMALREKLYPRVQAAERVALIIFGFAPIVGTMVRAPVITGVLMLAALVLFLSRIGMHLLTLPVEWDASFGKALPVVARARLVAPHHYRAVRRVLTAAALTYVAAALADLFSFWRWMALLRGRGL